jgi:hypothetical protein
MTQSIAFSDARGSFKTPRLILASFHDRGLEEARLPD